MKLKRLLHPLLCTALLLLTGCAATGGRLPDPETLVQRHIRAAYGEEGIGARRSMVMEGELSIEDYDVTAPITLKLELPDKRYFSTHVMGTDVVRSCMADRCWSKELGAGVKELTGDELAFMKELSDLFRLEHLDRYYRDLETVRITSFDDQPAYEVVLTRQNGQRDHWYFSTDTGLWLGGMWTLPESMGGTQITQYFENYKSFDGLKLATKIVEVTPNQTSRITIDEVKFEDIPDREFALGD